MLHVEDKINKNKKTCENYLLKKKILQVKYYFRNIYFEICVLNFLKLKYYIFFNKKKVYFLGS